MKDSIIILSGGMDSTTMLYEYKDEIALALSFNYGSNHNEKELYFARLHCDRLDIPHIIIPLEFIHDYFHSSLGGSGRYSKKATMTTRICVQRLYHSATGLCWLLQQVWRRAAV